MTLAAALPALWVAPGCMSGSMGAVGGAGPARHRCVLVFERAYIFEAFNPPYWASRCSRPRMQATMHLNLDPTGVLSAWEGGSAFFSDDVPKQLLAAAQLFQHQHKQLQHRSRPSCGLEDSADGMAVMSDLQEEPEESDLADPQQQQLQGELAGEGLAASDPLAGFQLDLSHWEARLKPAPPAPLASQPNLFTNLFTPAEMGLTFIFLGLPSLHTMLLMPPVPLPGAVPSMSAAAAQAVPAASTATTTSTGDFSLPAPALTLITLSLPSLCPCAETSAAADEPQQQQVVMVKQEPCLERYRQKKARRHYSKKIRYQLRKINADKRPRIKGRFVKKDELASFLATQRGGGAAAGHVDEQMMDEHVHQHHGGLYDESYFDDIPMPDPDSDYCDE
eukprot:XP_001700595.1 predicted protein [Chlamydomonas reinhardtii]